ncbi:hypothetical protein AOQ84DRAFT_385464 [Glonium stellatum]|uniref:Uncharacterized protein n=1 Tax=Glonium stellatum TaxID=574774 RepID=A0A8E2F9Z7_9PEZI|nr:hypothetical protein AOQ84DRAFT_385464 [Glonium stellatum]
MKAASAATLAIVVLRVSAQGAGGSPPNSSGPSDFNLDDQSSQNNPLPRPWGPSYTEVVEYVECSSAAPPAAATATEDVTVTICPQCTHKHTTEQPWTYTELLRTDGPLSWPTNGPPNGPPNVSPDGSPSQPLNVPVPNNPSNDPPNGSPNSSPNTPPNVLPDGPLSNPPNNWVPPPNNGWTANSRPASPSLQSGDRIGNQSPSLASRTLIDGTMVIVLFVAIMTAAFML